MVTPITSRPPLFSLRHEIFWQALSLLNASSASDRPSLFQRDAFFDRVSATGHPALGQWLRQLTDACGRHYGRDGGELLDGWKSVLEQLPAAKLGSLDASGDTIKVDANDPADSRLIRDQLLKLLPWRVGPWQFAGVDVDSEWRSHFKWQRIAASVYFDNAKVLDVGCNNGYFGFKAIVAGAAWVMGVEPFLLYNVQHEVFRRYHSDPAAIGVMPISEAQIPDGIEAFDVALSMGVLYHRSDPVGHLRRLHGSLRRRGQLVLETMAIDSADPDVIVPEGKFAKMRGVWFVPSIGMLKRWLRRIGFDEIRIIDVSVTSDREQRRTDFMPFESLSDFVDSKNQKLTVEGYPMPSRVVISALRRR